MKFFIRRNEVSQKTLYPKKRKKAYFCPQIIYYETPACAVCDIVAISDVGMGTNQ